LTSTRATFASFETDRFGNPISKLSIPCNTYGISSDQAKAIIGDAAAAALLSQKAKIKPLKL